MLIRDIMSKDIEIVAPDAFLHEVARKMSQRDVGSVIVVRDDRLIGMITDRDIAVRCVAEGHDSSDTTAEKIMTPEILYCRDTDDADTVARDMAKNKVRRMPVLDANKRLVGLITLGDLASHSNHLLCGQVLGEICTRAAA
ncbi:MAG: CBS domain-containing protein [Alphaproteobacteria bacterium]|nr:CBS domain-containing protein [Alphaproteobacteria bacterium]MBU0858427.1 CBS domain-containing protein [Alphaproteobacteria bacterium]